MRFSSLSLQRMFLVCIQWVVWLLGPVRLDVSAAVSYADERIKDRDLLANAIDH